jgi:predicted nucleic acid-binding protein
MTLGLTFDTSALIALERNRQRAAKVFRAARDARLPVTVPTVVIAEWVRAGAGERARERLLHSMIIEPLTRDIAEKAGRAIGAGRDLAPDTGTIDAIVIASAWLRGDTIVTADVGDMYRLRDAFPPFAGVQIERV